MNLRVVWFVLSRLMLAEAVVMSLPLLLAVWYRETGAWVFLCAMLVTAVLALELKRRGQTQATQLTPREGVAITGLGWLLAVVVSMLPYLIGGYLGPLDAIFESMSGLTGTGSTVISGLEELPQSLLFWRMMTHWFGGLGIIVIFIAILPQTGQSTVYMYNAETSGPSKDRVLPRLRDMTRILFEMYVCFTAVAALVYWLCGLAPLTALMHAMSTLGTGGFSTFDANAMHFDNWPLEAWMTGFMILAGGNFSLYYRAWRKGPRVFLHNTEFKAYLGIELVAMLLVGGALVWGMGAAPATALRYASFQVGSISTTGFVSADYDQWPAFAQGILLLLMLGGGCAGSTAGGLKIARVVLLFKQVWYTVQQKLHPRRVLTVQMNGERVSADVCVRVGEFFFLYITFIVFFALLYTWNGVGLLDAIGMSVSTMSNVGPAFGVAGATQNFAGMPDFTKLVLCCEMLLGRLEIFTLVALLRPDFWQSRHRW